MSHKAYMIGAGIGNLAAAIYLIRDGKWAGDDITIMGLDMHGANDGESAATFQNQYGYTELSNDRGFLNRGGRMLNEETYENIWDVLGSVPSLDNPDKSVTQEILDFDHAHPTHDIARLIDSTGGIRDKGDELDYKHMQFDNKDRYLLTKLMTLPESKERELDDISIEQWFEDSPHMFTTNFWYMWQTTFAFKPSLSAMELRRYMNRMILEFSRINTLAGVTRSPYNQYESIIMPMRNHLTAQGVKFVNELKVTEFEFKDTAMRDEIVVTGLKYENVRTGETGSIEVDEDDLVFDTNGSITDSSSIGDLDTAIVEDMRYAPSALLWKQATEHFYDLGHPDKFFGDRAQSEWMSFTVTNNTHDLINEISRITKQEPGNALNTFIDSDAMLSLVVHHQPHYHAQKENEAVFWGYFLFPRKNGDFVDKQVMEMTGRDMLIETLGHLERLDTTGALAAKRDQIMSTVVNVLPAYMPYASSLFNRRAVGDRPLVVPKHSKNLAFISQFAEIPFDMVFTEQYSVRCAQIAVYHFLGVDDDKLTRMHHYEKDPKVLAKSAVTMFR
ncbi:oleate hydratase [Speluncibacter jeojiensis]|uniref:Oleate hydratase n=1 Tax=Speluncibacter jeojiensis TaxID=2710754 RepID=A0A9X4M7L4_9ACTN|nr:oleate hydratase [Corynebacteriales bacterium D3-21]